MTPCPLSRPRCTLNTCPAKVDERESHSHEDPMMQEKEKEEGKEDVEEEGKVKGKTRDE